MSHEYCININYILNDLYTFESIMIERYKTYISSILEIDSCNIRLFFKEELSENELIEITNYVQTYSNPVIKKNIKVINSIITNSNVSNECYTVCSEITYIGSTGYYLKECVVNTWLTPDTPNDSQLETFKYYIKVMDASNCY